MKRTITTSSKLVVGQGIILDTLVLENPEGGVTIKVERHIPQDTPFNKPIDREKLLMYIVSKRVAKLNDEVDTTSFPLLPAAYANPNNTTYEQRLIPIEAVACGMEITAVKHMASILVGQLVGSGELGLAMDILDFGLTDRHYVTTLDVIPNHEPTLPVNPNLTMRVKYEVKDGLVRVLRRTVVNQIDAITRITQVMSEDQYKENVYNKPSQGYMNHGIAFNQQRFGFNTQPGGNATGGIAQNPNHPNCQNFANFAGQPVYQQQGMVPPSQGVPQDHRAYTPGSRWMHSSEEDKKQTNEHSDAVLNLLGMWLTTNGALDIASYYITAVSDLPDSTLAPIDLLLIIGNVCPSTSVKFMVKRMQEMGYDVEYLEIGPYEAILCNNVSVFMTHAL